MNIQLTFGKYKSDRVFICCFFYAEKQGNYGTNKRGNIVYVSQKTQENHVQKIILKKQKKGLVFFVYKGYHTYDDFVKKLSMYKS